MIQQNLRLEKTLMPKKITIPCFLMLIGLALVTSLHEIERSNAQVIARDQTAIGETYKPVPDLMGRVREKVSCSLRLSPRSLTA